MYKSLITLIALWLIAIPVFAQQAWKLSAEKEGIRVYTRPVVHSKINAVKVECSLAARPSQLVYAIMDIDKSYQWVYHGKLARIIKKVSPTELYYYSEVIVPWPCQNRDYVSHIMVSQNPQNKIVTINAPCVTGFVPEKNNIVRITHSVGNWIIEPGEGNIIKVAYELEVDPAGSVPAWLINMFATQGPMETFHRLKLQLQKPEFKNIKLSFIQD